MATFVLSGSRAGIGSAVFTQTAGSASAWDSGGSTWDSGASTWDAAGSGVYHIVGVGVVAPPTGAAPSGLTLSATLTAASHARAGPLDLHISLAGHIDAGSAAGAHFLQSLSLAGRITAQSKAEIVPPGTFVIQGRIKATSDGRAEPVITFAATHARQTEISIIT
jgi:hypothetical protein